MRGSKGSHEGRIAPSRPNFLPRSNRRYLAFNKPYGVATQFSPLEGKATLADFDFPADVYSVGRLDHDSEGLLILSDDPALTDRLLNPANAHRRSYLVQVERVPDERALKLLRRGVEIRGSTTRPATVRLLDDEPSLPPRSVPIRTRLSVPTSWLELTLTEGRNRQVRRMTAAVGHPTLRLVRFAIEALRLDALGLAPGDWRDLTTDEFRLLVQQSLDGRRW